MEKQISLVIRRVRKRRRRTTLSDLPPDLLKLIYEFVHVKYMLPLRLICFDFNVAFEGCIVSYPIMAFITYFRGVFLKDFGGRRRRRKIFRMKKEDEKIRGTFSVIGLTGRLSSVSKENDEIKGLYKMYVSICRMEKVRNLDKFHLHMIAKSSNITLSKYDRYNDDPLEASYDEDNNVEREIRDIKKEQTLLMMEKIQVKYVYRIKTQKKTHWETSSDPFENNLEKVTKRYDEETSTIEIIQLGPKKKSCYREKTPILKFETGEFFEESFESPYYKHKRYVKEKKKYESFGRNRKFEDIFKMRRRLKKRRRKRKKKKKKKKLLKSAESQESAWKKEYDYFFSKEVKQKQNEEKKIKEVMRTLGVGGLKISSFYYFIDCCLRIKREGSWEDDYY